MTVPAYSDASRAPGPGGAENRSRKGSGAGGVMSMLSIFLLLLAFFLMLNSLARFETTRTRAVLGSLNATFNIGNPEGREHELGSFVGRVGAASRLHTEAGTLLRTLFGVDRFELIRIGNVIVIELDSRAIFVGESGTSPSLLVFSTRLADAVLPPPPGVDILSEVTVRRGPGALDEIEPDVMETSARRAGTVVRAFERAGFAAADMTAGIGAGDPRRVRIEFRVIDTPFVPLRTNP
ncbi:MAG: hypothetical protein JJ899_16325 [Alphaproteobacteria bacterium]|nr:hypothetical protein [Alphaproteobacteria bacterium]